MKWIRDHCAADGLELVRAENFSERSPEEQRAAFSLARFTVARVIVARVRAPGLDGWAPRRACHRHIRAGCSQGARDGP
ncbi:hypothetical protein AB0L75_18010 [Streptomyces sp. NPDC052101]|uniref:hypothetical protein n=1 Tax=Streptomyces sp. NPDC052101 TaxID=3155763 RepID=UPI00341A99F1